MGRVSGIWYDIQDNCEATLDTWHLKNELTGAFQCEDLLRIRRYESLSEGPRYFCLYEYASGITQFPAQSSCAPSLQKKIGSVGVKNLCSLSGRLILDRNPTIGGTATTIRIRLENNESLESIRSLLAKQIFMMPGITSVMLWLDDAGSSSEVETGIGQRQEAAILVEGVRPGSVAAAWTQCAANRALNLDRQTFSSTAYRLLQITSRP